MTQLTRRTFLKLMTATGAVAVIESQLGPLVRADELIRGGKSVSRTTGLPRQAVPSTCLQCPARCGIVGFVEERALVKIEGNPKDPNSRGRICAKGLAGINQVYNPDRLLYPIRRAGARGEGKWQRISWEEALDELAARLKAVRESGRPEELVFLGGLLEGTGGLVGRFLSAFGTPSILDEMALYEANKRVAHTMTWGDEEEVADVARTRYILNFGANPYESHPHYLPLAQRIVDAKMRGAKLVTFDPRLSHTATLSDEWFPIKPGTDAVVALGIAQEIMRRGLFDPDFLSLWTNTSVEALAAHLAPYTPQMAARESGLRAADIERIALEYATTKPATTLTGGGLSQHRNGTESERAVAMLNALTGNVDVPGGYCLPRRYSLREPAPVPPPLERPSDLARPSRRPLATEGALGEVLPRIRAGQQRVSVLMTYMANPAYSSPNTSLAIEVLKDQKQLPYYVAVDSYLSESAVLADLVLPATTYLEGWDIQSMPAYEMVPFVSLMQPIIPPLGEARPFPEVCLDLAKAIGLQKYFPFGTVESYIAATITGLEGLAKAGGLAYLKENGVWFDPEAQPAYKSYAQVGFKTPSRRFEIYSPVLARQGRSPLPAYQPVRQGGADEDLVLITFQFNVHTYGRTAHCLLLSEIVHDNPVWIHPETAQARGIKRGDRVQISSPAGTITSRAWLTQGIRPGVVAMGACVGHWEFGRVAQAKAFRSEDPNTALLWWERHGNGTHPHRIIPVTSDEIGGGPEWMVRGVSLTKI